MVGLPEEAEKSLRIRLAVSTYLKLKNIITLKSKLESLKVTGNGTIRQITQSSYLRSTVTMALSCIELKPLIRLRRMALYKFVSIDFLIESEILVENCDF